jgi:hypothetical protein
VVTWTFRGESTKGVCLKYVVGRKSRKLDDEARKMLK